MPAYNARAYIGVAIESVLAQDYPNLELIVVDDGSKDGTPDEARRFGDRVQVIEQQNAGPAAARNRGVAASRGELIAFMDADDLWVRGKTASQVSYLQRHPDVGIVFGRLERWFGDENGVFPPPPSVPDVHDGDELVAAESGWIYPQMLLDSVIWIVSAMVRRSLWDELGGLDEALHIGEDYDFFIRASRLRRIDEQDQVVAIYRIHKASTTQVVRTNDIEYRVLQSALQRYGDTAPDGSRVNPYKLRERQFRLCFNFGYRHFWSGDPRIARRAFREALGYFHFRAKAWIYLVLSAVKTFAPRDCRQRRPP